MLFPSRGFFSSETMYNWRRCQMGLLNRSMSDCIRFDVIHNCAHYGAASCRFVSMTFPRDGAWCYSWSTTCIVWNLGNWVYACRNFISNLEAICHGVQLGQSSEEFRQFSLYMISFLYWNWKQFYFGHYVVYLCNKSGIFFDALKFCCLCSYTRP
jgi:hypothetical protein